jgi:hypothetical protein
MRYLVMDEFALLQFHLPGVMMRKYFCLAIVAALVLLACSEQPSRPDHLRDVNPYSAQLHLHGLTNHNASEKPASMQWHSHFAAENGIDVIWWTDHYHGFDLSHDFSIPFRPGQLDPETLEIKKINVWRRYLTNLRPWISGGTPDAELKKGHLTMRIRSSGGERPARFLYYPESELGKIRFTSWVRPVTSGLEFRGKIQVGHLDPNGAVEIESHLSWHFRERAQQDTLLFRFLTTQDAGDARPTSDHSVTVDMALPEGWENGESVPFVVDLLSAAELLSYGTDNAMSEIAFGISAVDGSSAEVTFSDLALTSRSPDAEHQIQVIQEFAARYEQQYGVTQHVGIEFGDQHSLDRPHMDAHFPRGISDFARLSELYKKDLEAWVAAVHDVGGLVTVNHIFGAAGRRRENRTRAEMEDVVLVTAQSVLDHEVYHGDVFEAGYLARAGATIQDHLKVWDILLANGHRIYGDATTDCHGGEWGLEMKPNPMVTWIWAEDTSPPSLLEAMRSGRLYFGNPYLWKGELSIGVAGGWMGDVVLVKETAADLVTYASPLPGDSRAYVVQARIGSGLDVDYLHDRTVYDPRGPFALDTSDPSFVRVELYWEVSPDSLAPLAFSNPIFLIPEAVTDEDAAACVEMLRLPYLDR